MYKDYVTVCEDATEVAAIKNSLMNIIMTPRGSLPGKPRFGCDLYYIIFQPLDPLTESMAKNYIRESVREYEDRVSVIDIELTREEAFNKLIINITFKYIGINISSEESETSNLTLAFNV